MCHDPPVRRGIVGFVSVGALLGVLSCGDRGGGASDGAACVRVVVNRNDPDLVGGAEVLVVDEEGNSSVVTGDWVATEPSLAPDGTAVAVVRAEGDYESAGPASTSLWVVDIDGESPRQVTAGPVDDMPAWSPDGATIAYSAGSSGAASVAVVPSDGGETRIVAGPPGRRSLHPAWSPDGHNIAYASAPGNAAASGSSDEVWIVGADGSGGRRLAEVPDVHSIDWDPDGTSLLVSTFSSEDGKVVLLDVDTGGSTTVAEHATMAAWSPDGTVLYFADNGDEPGRQWRLARGRVVGGVIEREEFVGDVADYLYPYFGLDAGGCHRPG